MSASGTALPEGFCLGSYKLLKVLGRGSSGIAYISWDERLKRNVVLKECFPSLFCVRDQETKDIGPSVPDLEPFHREAMAALRKEAQTLASLNHEHIVRVYEIFEAHGSLFYAMPWLEGGSLSERLENALAEKKSIPPEQAVAWLTALLDCLEYLHAKGIYHRDIKPGNILFDDRNQPVLIDFGAALNKPEAIGTITQGEYTPTYASPEQMTGKGEIGPWPDLYALASTWYRLVSGLPVEQADKRLMHDDVAPLSGMTLPHPWPHELLLSIDQNLHLRPEERCQTAGEWKKWLEQGAPKRLRKRSSHQKVLVPVALACLAVLAALGVWPTFTREPAEKPAGTLSTKPSADFKEALYQKVRSHFKLESYLNRANEHEQKVAALQSRCFRELDELNQKLHNELRACSTQKEVRSFIDSMNERYHPLLKKWQATSQKLSTAYRDDVILPLSEARGKNIMATYPAETREEELLLPFMEDRFRKESDRAMASLSLVEFDEALIHKYLEQTEALFASAIKREKELPPSGE